MLGGLAIIGHGLTRPTKDMDVWLDPGESSGDWIDVLYPLISETPGGAFFAFSHRSEVSSKIARDEIEEFGVIRINGLNVPIDIFRRPNECLETDFERFWENSTSFSDGTHLPDPIDLYLTKTNTGRKQDEADCNFLEVEIKNHLERLLPACSLPKAESALARFSDPRFLEYALENPDESVRDFALAELAIFEADGDPFSRDILERWKERSAT